MTFVIERGSTTKASEEPPSETYIGIPCAPSVVSASMSRRSSASLQASVIVAIARLSDIIALRNGFVEGEDSPADVTGARARSVERAEIDYAEADVKS